MDKIESIEYSEEAIKTLFILANGLSELLLERGWIDEQSFDSLLRSHRSTFKNNAFLSIPVTCKECGRNGLDRVGEDTKCVYCGAIIRFDINDPRADDILFPLDTEKLFSFTVKETDMQPPKRPPRYDGSEMEESQLTKLLFSDEQLYFSPGDECYIDDGGVEVSRAFSANHAKQGRQYYSKQNILTKHQHPVNLLCQVMLTVWDHICTQNVDAGEMMLKEFLTIDEKKIRHQFEPLYTPVKCAKCQTEQYPSSLFQVKCISCSEPLPVKLLPGLLVMKEDKTEGNRSVYPRNRKFEYLYTLFEALYICVSKTYGCTPDDLAAVIIKKVAPQSQINSQRICSSCQRPISLSLFLRGHCPYCGNSNNKLFLDRFF
jgi:ribosomal protein S27E